jgi:hypothetical protein
MKVRLRLAEDQGQEPSNGLRRVFAHTPAGDAAPRLDPG